MASGKGYGEESSWFCSASSLEKMAIIPFLCLHRQIRDMLKGHLQVVKAQGQDESVNPEESCQAVTHSAPSLGFFRFQEQTQNPVPPQGQASSPEQQATAGLLVEGGLRSLGREWQFLRTYSFEKQAIPISTDQWHTASTLQASKALSQAIFPFTKT